VLWLGILGVDRIVALVRWTMPSEGTGTEFGGHATRRPGPPGHGTAGTHRWEGGRPPLPRQRDRALVRPSLRAPLRRHCHGGADRSPGTAITIRLSTA